ncbi:1-pyrroline-5-carboxylate dehydrogenase [Candidatus Wirthbacteria bacterium CG2_30_54_11]|uniref:L-glutamate gamma-semialdehyde dehydrogenase n=1 Tax=Candidatus Wirthbacteria bacterium CG2_30_54_11 TaxID=1817892 RepID=A0A1J5IED6_9BACT|nr:MAG: 1-pyrroline-5-carboxylate dehydrogenase [Candidatus Wirthbacteria bacterium CG2_30_54_11]
MENTRLTVKCPANQPVLTYAPNSSERHQIERKLKEMTSHKLDIPIIINGEEIRTTSRKTCVMPHDHQHVLATYSEAGEREIQMAIQSALDAREQWMNTRFEERAAIFARAADLLAGPRRSTLNAATMLGQSKTVHQAEIDSACETIDFLRFNPYFASQIYGIQPDSLPGTLNHMDFRPLEGFVFGVTPFNFTAIGANIPTAPILMGNTVVWKPASTAVYSSWFLMQLYKEAGLPDGVINFLPGRGSLIGDEVLSHPDLAGVHFTGSTAVFQHMWKTVGTNIGKYKTYPRLVGETGGKDFIMVHPSADPRAVITAIIRGAFEYQGQKCSAASRAYIPSSLWYDIRDELTSQTEAISMGDVQDLKNFVSAVIDQNSFDHIKSYFEIARSSDQYEIIAGGQCDDKEGYFVRPTLILSKDPRSQLMSEEIFGPVLTIHVYPDNRFAETLALCDQTSPYALTGSIMARDREAIRQASNRLRFSAGNFYINDKPTGAMVNQQPFGGSRASGTNDKGGSLLNLLRWTSPRTVKETLVPPTSYTYPFMRS